MINNVNRRKLGFVGLLIIVGLRWFPHSEWRAMTDYLSVLETGVRVRVETPDYDKDIFYLVKSIESERSTKLQ
jgi:hypothetical protein